MNLHQSGPCLGQISEQNQPPKELLWGEGEFLMMMMMIWRGGEGRGGYDDDYDDDDDVDDNDYNNDNSSSLTSGIFESFLFDRLFCNWILFH